MFRRNSFLNNIQYEIISTGNWNVCYYIYYSYIILWILYNIHNIYIHHYAVVCFIQAKVIFQSIRELPWLIYRLRNTEKEVQNVSLDLVPRWSEIYSVSS